MTAASTTGSWKDSKSSFLGALDVSWHVPLFLFRFALSAVNMEQTDYDSRTALHIAAAEGDVSLAANSFWDNFEIKEERVKYGIAFVLQARWKLSSS